MSSARVTSNGRITIPIEVRERPGLQAGTRVDFVQDASGVDEFHAATRSVRDLRGIIPPPARPVTIEEMNDAIAAGAADSMK